MTAFTKVLKAKIHRATVTHADLHYEGSITIPLHLTESSGIRNYECVAVWNIITGARFETYAIEGLPDSNSISINGAAAHLAAPGDLIIIAAFSYLDGEALRDYRPKLIFVDSNNQIVNRTFEVPGPEEVVRV